MTTATTAGGWVAIALGLWLILSPLAAILIGKAIRGPQELDTQGRERLGISEPTSISEYVAQQDAKVARAKFRHASRYGKDAA